MTPVSELARSAALLEFTARHGTVALATPVQIGGANVSGCSIRQGVLVGPDGSRVGSVSFGRQGMLLVGNDGQALAQFDRYGVSETGVALSHPVHGADWSNRVAGALGRPVVAVRTATTAPSGGVAMPSSVATPPATAPYSDTGSAVPTGGGMNKAVLAGVALVALLGVGAFALSGSSEEAPAPETKTEAAPAAPAPAADAGAAVPAPAIGDAPAAPAAVPASGDAAAVGATPTASARAAAPAAAPAAASGSAGTASSSAPAPSAAPPASALSSAAPSARPSAPAAPSGASAATNVVAAGQVTVEPGQTLSMIGRVAGVQSEGDLSGWIEACMRLNGLQDANLIEPGQALKLPSVPPPAWVGDLYTVQEYPGLQ